MAKAKALAKTEAAADQALNDLGDFFDSVSVDGMADVSGEDIKLASKLFNMGGLDSAGNQRRKNTFFDTITEATQETVDCVLLLTQKSHRWDEFDNAEKKTNVLCQSSDRITGRMADGTERPCQGCPDRGWFKKEDGSPLKKCGEVHNVVAVEHLTNRPFIIRFKKTSLKPFRTYLMRHHFGARTKADGSRGNVPLFAFRVTLSLSMHESGNYAMPTLTRGDVLSRDEVIAMSESAKGYVELMQGMLSMADTQEQKHNGVGSISSDDFADS